MAQHNVVRTSRELAASLVKSSDRLTRDQALTERLLHQLPSESAISPDLPDAIFPDLPEENGFSTAMSHTPIVAVTAIDSAYVRKYAEFENDLHELNRAAAAYLKKPRPLSQTDKRAAAVLREPMIATVDAQAALKHQYLQR